MSIGKKQNEGKSIPIKRLAVILLRPYWHLTHIIIFSMPIIQLVGIEKVITDDNLKFI